MTLESSKNMGGIGALLMVIGCLGFLGAYTGILSLIGVILVLISLNGLANHYGEKGIFNYALYGILTFIAGIVVTAAIAFVSLLGFLADIGITFETLMDPTALSRIDWPALLTLESVWAFLAGLLLALVVIFVVLVISSFLIKKSLDLASAKTGVGMFHTAGLLLLIGAFLTIIIIGFLLMFIALILLIVAFFQIRTQPTVASSPQPTPPQ
jgi:uncharacterized membrane protein